jgi:hypothetical protein
MGVVKKKSKEKGGQMSSEGTTGEYETGVGGFQ